MIDDDRQVPAPSASAWSFDLRAIGAPTFVVLRTSEAEAREALVTHLMAIGSPIPHTIAAERLVNGAPSESVAVVW